MNLCRGLFLLLAIAWCGSATAQEWVNNWLDRVSETQAEQPHWITPLVTITPRLEQELRYDVFSESLPNGGSLWNVGGGKGLEMIPTSRTEVIVGIPAYLAHDNPASPDGFGDETFLLKYRIAAANENHGNYIVTAFLGGSIPTGSYKNGALDAAVTPTLAGGKGFGPFSVQSTLGVILPTGDTIRLGRPIAFNSAFQYHVHHFFWPEFEVNSTFFEGGPLDGKQQTFLTPGIIIGRLPIHNRVGLTWGAGVQMAVSQFHAYDHNVILTARLPF